VRSGELAPALVAAGGGGALLGAIAIHEHRRERAMRRSRLTYAAVFPVGTEPTAALSALESFWGLGFGFELVAEIAADEDGIHHLLHVPESGAGSIIDHLSVAIPGLRLDPVDARSTGPVTSSLRFVAPAQALLRTDDPVQSSRSLLSGLAALREGERVSLRWALRPSVAPPAPTASAKSLKARAEQRAWTGRVASPGFTTAGLLLVRATTKTRAGELSRHVTSVVRGRRGVGRGLLIRRGSVRSATAMPITGRTRGWLSAAELAAPRVAARQGADPGS
jgi:hypothetical protein